VPFQELWAGKLPFFGLYRRRNPQPKLLLSRKITTDENKYLKVGVFFDREKRPSIHHKITTLPPQINHDLPA
jgi:hypothetical protein